MGWLWNTAAAETKDMAGPTPEDRTEFARLNEAVGLAAKATKAIIEGGRALRVIREKQLYRVVTETWESYLSLHGLTRRRADQLVAAAGVLDAVSDKVKAELGTVVPDLSERALRPLVGMDADQAAEVVIEAARSEDGITPATIRKAAGRRKAKASKVPRPRRFKVPGGIVTIEWNRKGNGSVIEALAAVLSQAEAELEAQAEAA